VGVGVVAAAGSGESAPDEGRGRRGGAVAGLAAGRKLEVGLMCIAFPSSRRTEDS